MEPVRPGKPATNRGACAGKQKEREMADKPIRFTDPEVRALIKGNKTQTRLVLKDQPAGEWFVDPNPNGDGLAWVAPEGLPSIPIRLPYAAGDRLWVRE